MFVRSVFLCAAACSSTAFALPDLLVSSRLSHQVLRYDSAGQPVGVQVQGHGLQTPNGMAFSNGDFYLASRDGFQILKFNGLSNSFAGVFAQGPEMAGPSDILFGPNGDLYVCNSLADNIARYDRATGALVYTYAHPALTQPVGLAFSSDGRLFASSVTAQRLYELNPNANQVIGVVAEGGNLGGPADITFGPDGLLYAANPPANTITRFNPATAEVSIFVANASLSAPTSLAFGDDGKWYVSSFVLDKVVRISASGAIEGNFIQTGAGGLNGPQYVMFVPEPVGTFWPIAFAAAIRGRKTKPRTKERG